MKVWSTILPFLAVLLFSLVRYVVESIKSCSEQSFEVKSYKKRKMVETVYENVDLKRERSHCSFDKEEITNLIDGGKEKTKERRDIGKI